MPRPKASEKAAKNADRTSRLVRILTDEPKRAGQLTYETGLTGEPVPKNVVGHRLKDAGIMPVDNKKPRRWKRPNADGLPE